MVNNIPIYFDRWALAPARGLQFFYIMKTYVYIDGLNLYYSLKRVHAHKWLDLKNLTTVYLPPAHYQIKAIKYFTSRVHNTSEDPRKANRQDIYFRALRTIPKLKIICGNLKKRQVKGRACYYKEGKYREGTKLVTISKWEEKESDVNMATYIVGPAYKYDYDLAVLISNDTDLITPLQYVKKELKKKVGVISPRRKIHNLLIGATHFQKRITPKALRQSLFPEKMKDQTGSFFCPEKWKPQ